LTIQDLPNLERIDIGSNKLNKLNLTNLEKLTVLNVRYNYLSQTLDCFSSLVSLEVLRLDNNKFFGSLAPLGKLSKLKELDIENTNLNSDLECLSSNLEDIYVSDNSEIAKKIMGFDRDYQA